MEVWKKKKNKKNKFKAKRTKPDKKESIQITREDIEEIKIRITSVIMFFLINNFGMIMSKAEKLSIGECTGYNMVDLDTSIKVYEKLNDIHFFHDIKISLCKCLVQLLYIMKNAEEKKDFSLEGELCLKIFFIVGNIFNALSDFAKIEGFVDFEDIYNEKNYLLVIQTVVTNICISMCREKLVEKDFLYEVLVDDKTSRFIFEEVDGEIDKQKK